MSHTSPAVFLVWGIVSCILFAFLVFHMWSFDHFRSLRWNHGEYPRAFKRIMTYSYLLSVPLLMTYSLGFATIKYRQGFFEYEGTVYPKPYTLWPEADQRAIFPLTLTFAIAWSLEMITHLEELCFWFFLVKSGAAPQDWFRSWYFRIWIVGSCVAIVYMPLLTVLTRSDPLKSEAYMFLGGSLGSLILTFSFTPILWAFPEFLANLKNEGVDTGTVVRLTKFQELNNIRILFRFIFFVPILLLGCDGVRPHKHINESMFWTDFLAIVAAFGCGISSAITLVIFFPRSVEAEIATKDTARRLRAYTASNLALPSLPDDVSVSHYGPRRRPSSHYIPASLASNKQRYSDISSQDGGRPGTGGTVVPPDPLTVFKQPVKEESEIQLKPNRRPRSGEMRGASGGINPLVHKFTSPIDLYGGGEKAPSQLTFTQH
ncbi:hypothetical protein C8R47DRAFT_1147403 [Mycena vitilis]|nr:hypothetical protein C8R47DRAFT_1147403 [Mycena vitilis]